MTTNKTIKNQAVIPSAALNRALSFASRGAGKEGIYEMMQVTTKNDSLTVHCFNGTMGVAVQTAVEDQGIGIEAVVNAQALVSQISNMSGAITLSQDTRRGLKIECDTVSVSLKGTQSGELPALEDDSFKEVCVISGEALINALQVSVSAETEAKRPELNAVWFDISANRLTTIAADGNQAALHTALVENGQPATFLLPLVFVHWMRNVPATSKVTIKENPNRIVVVAVDGNVTMTMATPKGPHQQFPALRGAFENVFAPGKGSRFTMDASAFYKAVCQIKALDAKFIALFSDKGNLCMRAKGESGKFHGVVGATNAEVSIFLLPKVVAGGVSLLDTPEVIYTGARAPLGVTEGALQFIFMPLAVAEEKEEETPSQENETEEQPIAVEIAQPVTA